MNGCAVRAVPEMNGNRAEFRKMHRAGWQPVRGGHLFATEADALVAAHEALLEHLISDRIVGFGERVAARTAAGAVFRPGKRPIPVERRR